MNKDGQGEVKRKLSELGDGDRGKTYSFDARIEEVHQTGGPTIFILTDGSENVKATAFVQPGVRAYPEVVEGDFVHLSAEVREYDNALELSIRKMKKLDKKGEEELLAEINKALGHDTEVAERGFLARDGVLDRLKDKFVSAAKLIKLTIAEGRPIVIRHHGDCDGYAGAVALEHAIMPLLVKKQKTLQTALRYYRRAACRAPYYEYSDASRDLSYAMQDMERFGHKEPLVIVVDNGSTRQDVLALKKLRHYKFKVIVIDHHYTGVVNGMAEVDAFLDVHLNPFLVGGSSSLTAGMLCTELAFFINKDSDKSSYLAALAGVGDHSSGPVFESYLKIAAKLGYSHDFLVKLALCVDFAAKSMRFIEGRSMIDDLLGREFQMQAELVNMVFKDIEDINMEQLRVSEHYMAREKIGKFDVIIVNVDEISTKHDYPGAGKIIGLLKDRVQGDVFIGLACDSLVMRARENKGFSVNALLSYLKGKAGHCFLEGGGHDLAGSIHFVPAAQSEIMKLVREYLGEQK